MSNNLRHWSALSKTDPSQTKAFQRAGGFKGTAIKPIWTIKQMTEHFGPCGVGWGMDKPEFTTMPVADEILVYCTVALWYAEPEHCDAKRYVYGVGGDKVAVKRRDGSVAADDEAFKKAYTDALSNAMKQIGVAADVHMGLFDDSKYVAEMREEFSEKPAPKPAATSRDEAMQAFFARPSYEFTEKMTKGSTSEWERLFRKAGAACMRMTEWAKLENDNAVQITHFTTTAAPPAVESFRLFTVAQIERLRQIPIAA